MKGYKFMIVLNIKKHLKKIYILLIVLFLFYLINSFNYKNANTIPTSSTPISNHIVILDAGHGKPDRRSSFQKWDF